MNTKIENSNKIDLKSEFLEEKLPEKIQKKVPKIEISPN